MSEPFGPLSHIRLALETTYIHPPEFPDRAYLTSPAIEVMTDFDTVQPRTTRPGAPIDEALEHEAAGCAPASDGAPADDEAIPSIGSDTQVVRGLFSSTQIGRQLRVDVDEMMTPAHSLAEMQREMGA